MEQLKFLIALTLFFAGAAFIRLYFKPNNLMLLLVAIYVAVYTLNFFGLSIFAYYGLKISLIGLLYFNIIVLTAFALLSQARSHLSLEIKWSHYGVLYLVLAISAILLTIVWRLPDAYEILIKGNFRAVRDSVYAGKMNTSFSRWQSYVMLFAAYSKIPVLLIATSFYCKRPLLSFVVLVFCLMPTVISSIVNVSRGMLLYVVFEIYVFHLFAKSNSGKGLLANRGVILVLITICVLLMRFMLDVSVSRFGDAASQSLLGYFSHSIYFFSSSVVSESQVLMGRFLFNSLLGSNWSEDMLVLTTGTGFFTFLGALYIDFGYAGGILFLLAMITILYSRVHKRDGLAYNVIYVFTCEQLFGGVFVWGIDQSLSWIIYAIFFVLIKALFQ